MEADAGNNGNAHRQMLARCQGYLMLELPQEAKKIVANETIVCYADFEKMADLAQMYIDHLIRLCGGHPAHWEIRSQTVRNPNPP